MVGAHTSTGNWSAFANTRDPRIPLQGAYREAIHAYGGITVHIAVEHVALHDWIWRDFVEPDASRIRGTLTFVYLFLSDTPANPS